MTDSIYVSHVPSASFDEKIDAGRYFGSDGAIAMSTAELDSHRPLLLTETKLHFIMKHVKVLYSALTAQAKGNMFQKMRILSLLLQLNYWANLVWQFASYRHNLDAGEYHVLMSVWARTLQVLHRLHLSNILTKKRALLHVKMMDAFKMIRMKADAESKNYSLSNNGDISPASRTHLLALSLLYELNQDGLYDFKESTEVCTLKENLWWFAVNFSSSNDREMAQLVCQLFRAIGHPKEAEEIALRVGNLDQSNKSKACL